MEVLPEGELMDRASRGLAAVIAARVDELAERAPDTPVNVVVLAGTGGNGGDALFAAAYLFADFAPEAEVDVTAVLTGGRGHQPALAALADAGVLPLDAQDSGGFGEAMAALADADVVIDGVYGIGGRPDLSADPDDTVARFVAEIPEHAYVVAVDLPSGADPSGRTEQTACVFADETVTFSLLKGVHLLAGEDACGVLTVVDIGIDEYGLVDPDIESAEELVRALAPVEESGPVLPVAERLDFDDVAALWPVPENSDDKYSRGVLGIVAGGENYTGAALLSCRAAVEAGAGMVRYVGTPGPTSLIRAQVPEAVLGAGRVQAWLVGPGLDPKPEAGDTAGLAQLHAARDALDSGLPCVVDAGGLDLLEQPRPGAGARTLLTPHAGELARLLNRVDPDQESNVSRAEVEADPLRHARRAAELLHATVLLKGNRTLVVPPTDELPVRSQADAPTWLATAGSGDVLAGLAGTLLASGLDPVDAGSLAALVHGVAGDHANPGGPVRSLAVAASIPAVVASLLRRTQD